MDGFDDEYLPCLPTGSFKVCASSVWPPKCGKYRIPIVRDATILLFKERRSWARANVELGSLACPRLANASVDPEWLAGHLQAFYRAVVQVDTRVDVHRISSLHEWTAHADVAVVEAALIAGARAAWSERVGQPIVAFPPVVE